MISQVKHSRNILITSLAVLLSFTFAHASVRPAQRHTQPKKPAPQSDYDPKRDAAADLRQAIAEAQLTKKNILVEVGGQWCIWCHIMDSFFQQNPDIKKVREDSYVTVKVNFSPENENKEQLSQYPAIPGYPHLFVLDSSGKLLHSQFTGELEAGKSYNRDKFLAFLKQWSPKGQSKE